ncbi:MULTISPECIES: DNA/RNA nuclease SfsA [unclassified Bartonella]|uniref:DNA/RNA nuclease SfsA n=1 Tax=unclassified Bartonella TaxID=2645622 RepID=UPI000999CA62|nr:MULTISPECIES: DNA/RNA nuclease SfsA [unclassified Bartonella]AQX28005.1 sugar fermentation stimulation protein A [Bartonella sp. JB15]AQX29281.1 sugar fermentation stimulation protein A [Bartonella sp. JB63]
MFFVSKLHPAKLICRYKRFLADVKKNDQHIFTVSVHNTGLMLGLTASDSNVWLSYNDDPKRKYPYQLEIVEADNTLVGINTTLANKLALEAVQDGILPEFSEYKTILSEQSYGQSRIDFLLRNSDFSECYLEVKNVHFVRQKGLAEFLDTITKRGALHLEEIIKIVQQGRRAAMLYVIQREDCLAFTICHDLDPIYGCKFDLALKSGVEFYAIKCHVSVEGIFPIHQVKVENSKKNG